MTSRRRPHPQEKLADVTFRCPSCRITFAAQPTETIEDPEIEGHPWRYFGTCQCGLRVEQVGWQRALMKAWANSTGPKTEAGKAASAKNLAGHPTPEETKRTRFNAMKHGMNARVATYFPARPGKYSFCDGCDVDYGYCASQPACVKQTEIFMLHHAAVEQRNPKALNALHADLQASLFSLLHQVIRTIAADGVKLQTPKYFTNEEGRPEEVKFMDSETGMYVTMYEIQQHPLFKPLGDLLSKNNLSLADMGITQRVSEKEEESMGNVKAGERDRELLREVALRQADAFARLPDILEAARKERARDPILIEHEAMEGDGA